MTVGDSLAAVDPGGQLVVVHLAAVLGVQLAEADEGHDPHTADRTGQGSDRLRPGHEQPQQEHPERGARGDPRQTQGDLRTTRVLENLP